MCSAVPFKSLYYSRGLFMFVIDAAAVTLRKFAYIFLILLNRARVENAKICAIKKGVF